MYGRAMLDARSFAAAAAQLCDADPDLAAIVERHVLPEFWAREPGLPTLVLPSLATGIEDGGIAVLADELLDQGVR